jgi:hypothetical protein
MYYKFIQLLNYKIKGEIQDLGEGALLTQVLPPIEKEIPI